MVVRGRRERIAGRDWGLGMGMGRRRNWCRSGPRARVLGWAGFACGQDGRLGSWGLLG